MVDRIKKIAIDVSPLSDGNSIRGVGHYTKQLVNAILPLTKTAEFSNLQVDLIEKSTDISNYDLVHYPYFDPFFLTLPNKTNQKRIVTVHDLIPREFPSHFPVGIKGEFKWFIQKNRVKQSEFIITVSHYSKHVIAKILNYPSDRIYVTHEAATPDFKPRSGKELKGIREKYKLPEKFVMYLGDINWNKNVPSLVKACVELDLPIVIVGSAATKNTPIHPWTKEIHEVQSYIKKYPKLITATGFVSDEDFPKIFNLATLYCQPSFAEGFGLSIVQAMQSGTPLVYSQESCLNEIADYSGIMFDPYSLDSIKKALNKMWSSPTLQKEFAQKGLERAKIFSWSNTARQTLSVYKLALIDEK